MSKDNKNTGAGKGDKARAVNKKKYDKRFEEIDWSAHRKKKGVWMLGVCDFCGKQDKVKLVDVGRFMVGMCACEKCHD